LKCTVLHPFEASRREKVFRLNPQSAQTPISGASLLIFGTFL
jgi:hypothetical protein